jgi:Ku70/Ku80 C-terminal arm
MSRIRTLTLVCGTECHPASCFTQLNPALAYHNEQLQATAFRDDYDPESFEDVTLPPVKGIHKVAWSAF